MSLSRILLLVVARFVQGRHRYHRAGTGAARRQKLVALGPWRIPALLFCSTVLVACLGMPVGVVVYWFLRGVESGEAFQPVWSFAANSVYVSALAAAVCIVFALPVSYLQVRFPSPYSAWTGRAAYLGYALPGIVVALALVFFGANYAPLLYQTIAMLVFGCTVRFLPQSLGTLRTGLLQISPRLEEASRSLGHSKRWTFWRVTLPLLRPGIWAGAALVFLTTMKELPVTLLLAPTGFTTLAVSIWSATSEAFYARASAPRCCWSRCRRSRSSSSCARRRADDRRQNRQQNGSKAGTGHLHEQAPPGPPCRPPPASAWKTSAKPFGAVAAVNDVSLALAKGQLLALLGPSGCGKTTLLRLIAGFEALDGGGIEIGGVRRRRRRPPRAARTPPRRHGLSGLRPLPSPERRPEHRLRLHRYAGDADKRVAEVAAMVGLDGLERRLPHELTGGQQQRVALARALAPEPDLVLLDEPFSNLDAGLPRARPRRGAQHPRAAGATAVFVTHDQEEALSLVDQVAVMLDGRVHQVGQPQQLYHQPATRSVAEFIGDANFFPGEANGQVVTCELGDLFLQYAAQGAVDVLRAPRKRHRQAGAAGHAQPCQERALLRSRPVRLDPASFGRVLDARVGPIYNFAIGQPVAVQVNGLVMAYPQKWS